MHKTPPGQWSRQDLNLHAPQRSCLAMFCGGSVVLASTISATGPLVKLFFALDNRLVKDSRHLFASGFDSLTPHASSRVRFNRNESDQPSM